MVDVKKLGAVREQIENTCQQLLEYCQARDWAGFDPYDALNSRVLAFIPFVNNRLTRIALNANQQAASDQPSASSTGVEGTKPESHRAVSYVIRQTLTNETPRQKRIDWIDDRKTGYPSISEQFVLVLGIQLSVADANGSGSSLGAEPRMHDLCCQCLAGRIRNESRRTMPGHGRQCRRVHPE